MYTCERLGENATEFRYTAVGGDHSGGSGSAWARAVVAVVGASLFAQACARRAVTTTQQSADSSFGEGGAVGESWAVVGAEPKMDNPARLCPTKGCPGFIVAGCTSTDSSDSAAVGLASALLVDKGSTFLGGLGLVLLLCCVAWSLSCRSRVQEESLLVVRELGVQVTTKYVDGREKSTFLDKAMIKAILINEGITMHRVVFYLAFVVTGRDKMVVAFENLKPRLHILVKIFRGTRAAILGEAGDDQPADDERSLDADTWGSNAPGVGGGGYGSAEVDARRGGTGMRRTDRIARRQARTEASAGGGGMGWPPPHAPN
eukprot:jgi/Undpi1/5602/HiC_scaffold_2.g00878.m1